MASLKAAAEAAAEATAEAEAGHPAKEKKPKIKHDFNPKSVDNAARFWYKGSC